MSRLVDCCPSDDEEMPSIKTAPQKPSNNNNHGQSVSPGLTEGQETVPTKSLPGLTPKKDLIPKTPSVPSSARKIRRLGTITGKSSNTLFQPFTPRGEELRSRRSPSKANMSFMSTTSRIGMSMMSFDESDSDLQMGGRTILDRRGRLSPELEETREEQRRERSVASAAKVQQLEPVQIDLQESAGSERKEDKDPVIHDDYDDSNEAADIARQLEETYISSTASSAPAENSSLLSSEASQVTSDSGSDFEPENTPERTARKPAPTQQKSLFDLSPIEEKPCISSPRKLPALQPKELNTLRSPIKRESFKPKNPTDLGDSLSILGESLSKLRIDLQEDITEEDEDHSTSQPVTPSRTVKTTKTLKSPSKLAQIPATPGRPSMDAFWDQSAVNEWTDQHSPRKLVLPPVEKSPTKRKTKEDVETRKSFDTSKHTIAENFLRELDEKITAGRIAEMSNSTGGVKLVWSKTLNTTAGRANWRRETIKTKAADGITDTSVRYKHYASIDLAEKVVDDEIRLLNVIAHEFCHLANFMINDMKTNPHGKEFKTWADNVTHEFSDRGVVVTTKHSYAIEFKYVWTCESCGTEYKRHSKSIDPKKHKCGGGCKGLLKQTKPTPRGASNPSRGATSATGEKKPLSDWQTFVKEQMPIVRGENKGIKQGEVMKVIAQRWREKRVAGDSANSTNMKEGPGGDATTIESSIHTPAVDASIEDVIVIQQQQPEQGQVEGASVLVDGLVDLTLQDKSIAA